MGGSASLSAGGPTAQDRVLVISPDQAVADQLQNYLEEDHGCQVQTVATYGDAWQLIQMQPPRTVFVDLRGGPGHEDPSELLNALNAEQKGPIPVVAITNTGYVCDWAGAADLIIQGHLSLPLQRGQLARLWEIELAETLAHKPMGASAPHLVESDSVRIKTFMPQFAAMLDELTMIAAHDVTLLIVGETGTGKTTLARMIHELSPRREHKLLTVGCGALPPELIESELFGHMRGSFTSAVQDKIGKFEAADGGSLLLDEIDVLSAAQQAKLLRVIETGEYEPVGSNDTRCSTARLIAASNRDLKTLMEQDEFRADLYYRLNVLEFHIPPLRNRALDIVWLTLDFVDEFCADHKIAIRRVHPDFLDCLKRYDWPGNIRELKNHIRRAVLFCRTGELTPKNLAPYIAQARSTETPPATVSTAAPLSARVARSEREMLDEALEAHSQNRTATAKALGISRVGLYKKMKKHGMIKPRISDAERN